MKKLLFTLSCLLCMPMSYAQLAFSVMDSIDANRINAAVLVHGDMWWNPVTLRAHCKFPADSKKHVGFAAALWMSAYDDAGQLHVSAQTYRQNGNDYWPGPLDASGALDYATSEQWAKIWKVRRSDVALHLSNIMHHTGNTPEAVLTWPAKGNAYAAGKDGVPLTITEDMAPFIDVNGDGTYQPLKGDYPDIKGEQILFWVFSDNGPSHDETSGKPLKVQVHALAYAYKRNTLIDYVVYHDYTVINKSGQDYENMRMGIWEDVDLGYYLDDFIGFDSAHRMAVTYNGTNNDGVVAGHPDNSYGSNPPARGLTFIRIPGDRPDNIIPAGSFMYVSNDPSILLLTITDTTYDCYLRSKYPDGRPLTYNTDSARWTAAGGTPRNYVYTDDPSGIWSECSDRDNPGDRRYVLASNDFTLPAGAKERLVMALVVDSSAGGCPVIENFNGLRQVADTAWQHWQQAVSVRDVSSPLQWLTVHPVPATQFVSIVMPVTPVSGSVLSVYNALGQRVLQQPAGQLATTLDIGTWPTGYYTVVVTGEEYIYRGRLIKQ